MDYDAAFRLRGGRNDPLRIRGLVKDFRLTSS
jgi:hypothetical protein